MFGHVVNTCRLVEGEGAHTARIERILARPAPFSSPSPAIRFELTRSSPLTVKIHGGEGDECERAIPLVALKAVHFGEY